MSETNLENLDTALAEDGVVVEPTAPAEPQIDAQGRAYATGKRKTPSHAFGLSRAAASSRLMV